MFVLIAGGGRTASQLANLLLAENHKVRIIEARSEVLAHLHRELPTETIVVGNATHPQILEQAGIQEAQVLAACTPRDADNLVLCFLARSRYQVPRTIAQISNPRNAWLFDERFHVDVALNESEILSRLIEEEMSMGDMMTLLKIRRGQYSVVEEKIPPGALAVGKAIQELNLSDRCIIAAIIRKGEMVVPRGATILEQGDEVLAITDRQGAEGLAALLSPPAGFNPRPTRRPENG
jgi:trk system potassium uptake protein TrkA